MISNSRGADLPQTRTVQRLLQRQGYRTAIFGKYLNAWPVEINPPFFDDWAISNGGFENTFWNMNGRVGTRHRYSTDIVADKAARFIRDAERRDDAQPWLAWVTPYAPHLPSTPAARHSGAPLPGFPLTPAMRRDRPVRQAGLPREGARPGGPPRGSARRRPPVAQGRRRDGRAA